MGKVESFDVYCAKKENTHTLTRKTRKHRRKGRSHMGDISVCRHPGHRQPAHGGHTTRTGDANLMAKVGASPADRPMPTRTTAPPASGSAADGTAAPTVPPASACSTARRRHRDGIAHSDNIMPNRANYRERTGNYRWRWPHLTRQDDYGLISGAIW